MFSFIKLAQNCSSCHGWRQLRNYTELVLGPEKLQRQLSVQGFDENFVKVLRLCGSGALVLFIRFIRCRKRSDMLYGQGRTRSQLHS